jgi:L-arabinose isomerase
MASLECVVIGEGTSESEFKKELRWNELYYYLAHGPQGQ